MDLQLLLSYAVLLGTALVCVMLGARVARVQKVTASLEHREAATFPLTASVMLVSLYLLFRFLGKDWVNLLLSAYFGALAAAAVGYTAHGVIERVATSMLGVSSATLTRRRGTLPLQRVPLLRSLFEVDEGPVEVSLLFVLAAVVGVGVSGVYLYTKHWMLNNVIGVLFCVQGISLFPTARFSIIMLMMWGLFVYDIFWVFGTDVMVTVARSLDAPIKIVWPRNFFDGLDGSVKWEFALLGLGDIVFPGAVAALFARFDMAAPAGKPRNYLVVTLLWYALSLVVTVAVLHVLHAAQPALLYIVPALTVGPLLHAVMRGELRDLLAFDAEKVDGDDDTSDAAAADEGADSDAGGDASTPKDADDAPTESEPAVRRATRAGLAKRTSRAKLDDSDAGTPSAAPSSAPRRSTRATASAS